MSPVSSVSLLSLCISTSFKDATCLTVFFHFPFFFSLNRKTLQLDWTGASESLILPQADFSGNCLSLLIFCQNLKSQLTRPTAFPCTSFFMISLQSLYVSMFHMCSHSSKTVHTYRHAHTLGCSIVFLKQSSAEESLPSWQLQRIQVQSYITQWGWAGLVGSRPSRGRDNPQSDGKAQQTVTRAQNRSELLYRLPYGVLIVEKT